MSLEDEATKSVRSCIDELEKAGIDPKQFAALARAVLGLDDGADAKDEVPEFKDDNVPGYEYVQRISTAAGRALAAQVEQMNGDWSKIRHGRYNFAMAMQSWANVMESYYSVVTEAWRGPSQVARPAWLVIPYSKSRPRAPELSVRIDGIFIQRTPLEYTKCESIGTAPSIEDIYAQPPEGVGTRVEIRLNDEAIQNLEADTDHMGFIYRKGMGAGAPLVIVVLRVIA